YNFTSGTTYGSWNGIAAGTNGGMAGLAVQRTGNYLYISNTTDNKIYILNKTTGAALGYINVTNPGKIAIDTTNNDLCVISGTSLLRYTNIVAGSPGTATLATTISGLTNPLGLAVAQDGSHNILVTDGETTVTVTQQVKCFAPTGGAAVWTLGQAGGYATHGPNVTNDKFQLVGMIATQTDGSFWITDIGGSHRVMHFSSTRQFLSQITYTRTYTAAGDQNDATRVFQSCMYYPIGGSLIEFAIDYSKPYTENQGWTAAKNWTYLNGKNILNSQYSGQDFTFVGFTSVSTLSNGHTYATIRSDLLSGLSTDGGTFSVVDLQAGGMRDTSYKVPNTYHLEKDGSFIYDTYIGSSTLNLYRLTRTGFDVNNNPQYSNSATQLTTLPYTNVWDKAVPVGNPVVALDNGQYGVYNNANYQAGMHLGVINPVTNQWQWQSMPGMGTLNGRGNYDTNVWYGGNLLMASGHSLITGYHGEAWRGAQANQFTQYNDDGLFIGQFGTSNAGILTFTYGSGGNCTSPFLVSHNGNLYLYSNDESNRSLQRWSLTGMDTIQEQSVAAPMVVGAATYTAGEDLVYASGQMTLPGGYAGALSLTTVGTKGYYLPYWNGSSTPVRNLVAPFQDMPTWAGQEYTLGFGLVSVNLNGTAETTKTYGQTNGHGTGSYVDIPINVTDGNRHTVTLISGSRFVSIPQTTYTMSNGSFSVSTTLAADKAPHVVQFQFTGNVTLRVLQSAD
ncbi:MAG: hypothetical protein WCI73_16140, partial [Phycisphaerae bacterium]